MIDSLKLLNSIHHFQTPNHARMGNRIFPFFPVFTVFLSFSLIKKTEKREYPVSHPCMVLNVGQTRVGKKNVGLLSNPLHALLATPLFANHNQPEGTLGTVQYGQLK